MNSSVLADHSTLPFQLSPALLLPSEVSFPFYYSNRERVLPFLNDIHLSLALPILAYWTYSLFFEWISSFEWSEKYKLHEPMEIQKRNKVTPGQVVKAVLFQQLLQTALGLAALEHEPTFGIDHREAMLPYAGWTLRITQGVLGERTAFKLLSAYGSQLTEFSYWWLIPTFQFLWGSFIIDTWQYFLHRGMHMNKFLYRHIHSLHHRLYCPYSYGALYNHPVEGFLLDSCGGFFAHLLSGLNTRQDIFLFTVSTLKTVDDHCGMALPWDPFQFLFGNNADYHDSSFTLHTYGSLPNPFDSPSSAIWHQEELFTALFHSLGRPSGYSNAKESATEANTYRHKRSA